MFDNQEFIAKIESFISYKKMSNRAFCEACNLSHTIFTQAKKNNGTIGVDKLVQIINIFPELSKDWLLFGRGDMLDKSEKNLSIQTNGSGSYNNHNNSPYTGNNIEEYEKELGYLKELLAEKERTIQEKERTIQEKDKRIALMERMLDKS